MEEQNLIDLIKAQDYNTLIVTILKSLTLDDLLNLEESLRDTFNLQDLSLGSSSAKNNEITDDKLISLYLDDLGSLNRIEALKVLNAVLNLSVSEAKEVLNSLPYCLFDNVSVKDAEDKKAELKAHKDGLILTIR